MLIETYCIQFSNMQCAQHMHRISKKQIMCMQYSPILNEKSITNSTIMKINKLRRNSNWWPGIFTPELLNFSKWCVLHSVSLNLDWNYIPSNSAKRLTKTFVHGNDMSSFAFLMHTIIILYSMADILHPMKISKRKIRQQIKNREMKTKREMKQIGK